MFDVLLAMGRNPRKEFAVGSEKLSNLKCLEEAYPLAQTENQKKSLLIPVNNASRNAGLQYFQSFSKFYEKFEQIKLTDKECQSCGNFYFSYAKMFPKRSVGKISTLHKALAWYEKVESKPNSVEASVTFCKEVLNQQQQNGKNQRNGRPNHSERERTREKTSHKGRRHDRNEHSQKPYENGEKTRSNNEKKYRPGGDEEGEMVSDN